MFETYDDEISFDYELDFADCDESCTTCYITRVYFSGKSLSALLFPVLFIKALENSVLEGLE